MVNLSMPGLVDGTENDGWLEHAARVPPETPTINRAATCFTT
jgi:hypothetical protein